MPPESGETRTASLGIRTWPSLKKVIDDLAKEDGRSTAAYIERVLIAHAKAAGRWDA
jgi:hypothetical protein